MKRLEMLAVAVMSFLALNGNAETLHDPFKDCGQEWAVQPRTDIERYEPYYPNIFRTKEELEKAHPNISFGIGLCETADVVNKFLVTKFETHVGKPYGLIFMGYKPEGYYYGYRYHWNNGGLDWDDCGEEVIVNYRHHSVASVRFIDCVRDAH